MLKTIIKKMIFKEKASSSSYIEWLRKQGVRIGENLYIVSVRDTEIDVTRPWLIEIGDNVTLTKGVTILTHGYDFSVIMNKTGELYGSSGKVKIGNNVFVGINSTILKGVEIGDNVIIGANSLMNKDIPDNVVVAGNPAKIIMTLDEYTKKRRQEYINEAKELAVEYYKVYKKKPRLKEFHEFFPLMFYPQDVKEEIEFLKYSKVRDYFNNNEPKYRNLDEFLSSCELDV